MANQKLNLEGTKVKNLHKQVNILENTKLKYETRTYLE